jgi:flagellar basal-body rod modification protein FlgD
MASVSGIWNQTNPANSLAANPLGPARPAAAASGSTASTDADGSTISANDFLTLLVTEMKNQDPTANTDPNQYVNQLVQVNSLEQLININQTLETGLGTPGTTPVMQTNPVADAASTSTGPIPPTSQQSAPTAISNTADKAANFNPSALNSLTGQAIKTTGGNLSVPNANPAAERVGHSLTHHGRIV